MMHQLVLPMYEQEKMVVAGVVVVKFVKHLWVGEPGIDELMVVVLVD